MGGVRRRVEAVYVVLVFLVHVHLAAAGCSSSGVTGSDDAGDCAVLLAAFAAWGNLSGATSMGLWATGIAAGTSYCDWDPSRSVGCNSNGRVSTLCVRATAPAAARMRPRGHCHRSARRWSD